MHISATEDEIERLADMILSGKVAANPVHNTVIDLVPEEAAAFFQGDRTAEEAARNIQSRMQIILGE